MDTPNAYKWHRGYNYVLMLICQIVQRGQEEFSATNYWKLELAPGIVVRLIISWGSAFFAVARCMC